MGGISTVWCALIEELLLAKEVDCLFMEYPEAEKNLCRARINIPQSLILRRKHQLPLAIEHISSPLLGNYLTYDGSDLSKYAADRRIIFHSPYYRTLKGGKDILNISTLHDFIHEKYHLGNPLRRMAHSYLKRRVLINADRIACVSDATLSDLSRLFPHLTHKAVVVSNGVKLRDLQIEGITQNLPAQFLLFVGGRESYKHFDKAVLFARHAQMPLVVCGSKLSAAETQMTEGIEIHLVQNIGDTGVQNLMRKATALLYPSEYEGFGMPIIEAQASGCPVIISADLNTRSIAGPALMLNDFSQEEIKETLNVLNNSRNGLISEGIANAQIYSSQAMAQAYTALYNEWC